MAGESGAPEDYTLSDLEDCTILLPGPLAALFMHRLRRCTVVTGPVGGATFAEGALWGVAAGWRACACTRSRRSMERLK